MRILALLALASASLCAREIVSAPSEDWVWRGAIAKGRAVEIRGITGDIRAIASRGGQVEVSARFGEQDGPNAVEMRVAEGPTGVTVCALRKGLDVCSEDPLAGPGIRIDYEVRVPPGVSLIARTVNGGIKAESLAGDVQASTVNGKVVVSTSGTVRAQTVNGSIEASLLHPFWSTPPEFSAVNGGISVNIPTTVRAGVHAETKNGRIVSDVPCFRGTATEQTLDGTIGGGGASNGLILRTINGTIELKQRF